MTNDILGFALNETFDKGKFANRLKNLLAEAGIDLNAKGTSILSVAKEMGISDETLRNMLSGKAKPSADILQNLANYFKSRIKGFTANRLFDLDDDTTPIEIVVPKREFTDKEIQDLQIAKEVKMAIARMYGKDCEDAFDDLFHEKDNIKELSQIYRLFENVTCIIGPRVMEDVLARIEKKHFKETGEIITAKASPKVMDIIRSRLEKEIASFVFNNVLPKYLSKQAETNISEALDESIPKSKAMASLYTALSNIKTKYIVVEKKDGQSVKCELVDFGVTSIRVKQGATIIEIPVVEMKSVKSSQS